MLVFMTVSPGLAGHKRLLGAEKKVAEAKALLQEWNGEDMLIVDCGVAFPDESMPGIDLVIPDFSYVLKNKHSDSIDNNYNEC